MVSKARILNALSNDKSLDLLDTIALESVDRNIIMESLKLTRRQYYSRISGLIKSGLIEKHEGKYFLTSFGKIVWEARKLIALGVENYWKLKAIDAIRRELPEQELAETMEVLIDEPNLRELLLTKAPPPHAVTIQNQEQTNTNSI
jgi:predicted transcriptional regulator